VYTTLERSPLTRHIIGVNRIVCGHRFFRIGRTFYRTSIRLATGGVNPRKDSEGGSVVVVNRRPRWPSMAGWQAL
jgi:hypothetical protein